MPRLDVLITYGTRNLPWPGYHLQIGHRVRGDGSVVSRLWARMPFSHRVGGRGRGLGSW